MTIELDTQPRGQLHGIGRGQRAGFGDFAPLADERENLIRAPHQHRVHDRPRLLRLSGDGLQHGLIRWITEEVWPANVVIVRAIIESSGAGQSASIFDTNATMSLVGTGGGADAMPGGRPEAIPGARSQSEGCAWKAGTRTRRGPSVDDRGTFVVVHLVEPPDEV